MKKTKKDLIDTTLVGLVGVPGWHAIYVESNNEMGTVLTSVPIICFALRQNEDEEGVGFEDVVGIVPDAHFGTVQADMVDGFVSYARDGTPDEDFTDLAIDVLAEQGKDDSEEEEEEDEEADEEEDEDEDDDSEEDEK